MASEVQVVEGEEGDEVRSVINGGIGYLLKTTITDSTYLLGDLFDFTKCLCHQGKRVSQSLTSIKFSRKYLRS